MKYFYINVGIVGFFVAAGYASQYPDNGMKAAGVFAARYRIVQKGITIGIPCMGILSFLVSQPKIRFGMLSVCAMLMAAKRLTKASVVSIDTASLDDLCALYGTIDSGTRSAQLLPPSMVQVKKLAMAATDIGFSRVKDHSINPDISLKKSNELLYTERIVLHDKDNRIIFGGDLHGSINALMKFLSNLAQQRILDTNFKIIDPQTHIVFGGDYVDRGVYGIETIAILMRLQLANPNHVHLVRGNHEDLGLGDRLSANSNASGFHEQIRLLYGVGEAQELIKTLGAWYGSMPIALFADIPGDEQGGVTQFCHGGIEPGYDPSPLLDYKPTQESHSICHRIDHTIFRSRVEQFINFCDMWSHNMSNNPALQRGKIIEVRSAAREYAQLQTAHLPYTVISDLHEVQCVPSSMGLLWNQFHTCREGCKFQEQACFGNSYSDQFNTISFNQTYHEWHHTQQGWNRVRMILRAHQHGIPKGQDEVSDKLGEEGISILRWNPCVITHVITPLYGYTPCVSYLEFRPGQSGSNLKHHYCQTDSTSWKWRVYSV